MFLSFLRSHLMAVLLFFTLILLHLFQEQLQPLFEFNRTAIYEGQWWRLVTGIAGKQQATLAPPS